MLILITVLFFINCKAGLPTPDCIINIKSEVTKNWIYNNDSFYYSVKKGFVFTLHEQFDSCLIGLSKAKIIKIFGDPSGKNKPENTAGRFSNSIKYSTSLPCSGKNLNCSEVLFYFDEYDKLILFGEQLGQVDVQH